MDPAIPGCDENAFNIHADWKEFYGDLQEEDPPQMLEPLGNPVAINGFCDSDHASNMVTRRSHLGILVFVCNALILTFNKKQNMVKSSTFGAKLVTM